MPRLAHLVMLSLISLQFGCSSEDERAGDARCNPAGEILWETAGEYYVGHFAVDESGVHFKTVSRTDLALNIRRIPADGGADTLFLDIDPGLNAEHLLKRGGTLYWTQNFAIMSSPLSAADPTELADNSEVSPNRPSRLREAGGDLYWDNEAHSITRVTTAGGMLHKMLASQRLISFDVDSSGTYALYSDSGAAVPSGVAKVGAGGEIIDHIAEFADGVLNGPELVVDQMNAYYFGVAAQSDLLSVPKDGSAAPTILVDDWPSYMADLVLADGFLYFQEGQGRTATLWRMPTAGGTPEAILSCEVGNGGINEIAVYGKHVYTTVRYDDKSTQIVRVGK